MKNLLITTTALVAVAGMAAADGHAGVSLSGNAEMGIASVDTAGSTAAGNGDAVFHQDIDVVFRLKGETDGGLSFGATVDLDEAGDLDTTSSSDHTTGATVFISGGFGTLTLGDTDGARDWAMTETGMGTAIADDHTLHAGYNNGNGNFESTRVLRYDNTFGDFGVAVSHEMEAASITPAAPEARTGVGIKYSADLGGTTLGLGLGYTDAGADGNVAGLSVSTAIAGFNVVLNYSTGEVDTGNLADPATARTGTMVDMTHTGIGIGYTVDALSFHANWGEVEMGTTKTDGYGLNVNYALGGGAIVALGYASDDAADRYSLGLRMNF